MDPVRDFSSRKCNNDLGEKPATEGISNGVRSEERKIEVGSPQDSEGSKISTGGKFTASSIL